MADNITLSTGQVTATDDVSSVHYPRFKVAVGADGSANDMAAPSDAQSPASVLPAGMQVWNGASFDRLPGPTEVTALVSAARTATTATATQTNRGARGLAVILAVSAAGTGTLTVECASGITGGGNLQAWTGPAVSSATSRLYLMYPGANETNMAAFVGRVVSQPLPRSFTLQVTKSDASSWTFALYYCLLP